MFALGMSLLACQSKPKPYAPGPTEQPISLAAPGGDAVLAHPLTSIGDNTEAYFSPDGKRVLFHSRNRLEHGNAQVYELDFNTRRERRVTFHDGENANAIYLPDGQSIVYASSTDEIKEDPEFIYSLKRKYQPDLLPVREREAALERRFQPHEIYISKLDGSGIRRLTKNSGYDAEPAPDPRGKRLVFASNRDAGQPDLYVMDLDGKPAGRLTKDPDYDSSPFISPDGKSLVWVRYAPDLGSAQIWIGDANVKVATALTAKKALNVSPFWHPNGQEIIFASNRSDASNFDLYMVDRKGLCLKRLTQSKSDELHPAFGPDGTRLLFTSNQSGRNQIYFMNLNVPAGCLDEVP